MYSSRPSDLEPELQGLRVVDDLAEPVRLGDGVEHG